MPKYRKGKKTIQAVQIAAIKFRTDGVAVIAPKEEGISKFITKAGYDKVYKGDRENFGVYYVEKSGKEFWTPLKTFLQECKLLVKK